MLIEIDGVVNDDPVPKETPPVADAYQSMVPEVADAPNTTEPASHLEAGVVLLTGGVMDTVARTAVREELHPKLLAST